jgi:glycosyltransferase involved in cell wall biosynthesis
MRCPSLSELPTPPPGKRGWPWNEECQQQPDLMPDGALWPKISVVTPSYNQGMFLEETIRSVLLQGYPDIEYIVRDGGSTDESAAIIRKYACWMADWVSERDNGQAAAINAGFARCTGDLIGWINSDDILLPEALYRLAVAHRAQPDALLLGDVIIFVDPDGYTQAYTQKNVTFENMIQCWRLDMRWSQPGTYVPRALYQRAGGLDEKLRYVFDRDWMCRLLPAAPVSYLHAAVAKFRMHTSSKTSGEASAWLPEHVLVTQRYWDHLPRLRHSLALAEMQVWFGAVPYLSVVRYQMNRRRGITHLWRAFRHDWRIIGRRQFLMVCAVAVTPQFVLRALRKFVNI